MLENIFGGCALLFFGIILAFFAFAAMGTGAGATVALVVLIIMVVGLFTG